MPLQTIVTFFPLWDIIIGYDLITPQSLPGLNPGKGDPWAACQLTLCLMHIAQNMAVLIWLAGLQETRDIQWVLLRKN